MKRTPNRQQLCYLLCLYMCEFLCVFTRTATYTAKQIPNEFLLLIVLAKDHRMVVSCQLKGNCGLQRFFIVFAAPPHHTSLMQICHLLVNFLEILC